MVLPSRCLATALLILLPLPALAAKPPCESETRIALYTEYYKNRARTDENGEPDVAAQKYAYDVAKMYMEKYGSICTDQYTEAVAKYAHAYDAASERARLTQYAFGSAADAAKAFETGRNILATTPNDLPTLIMLTHVGDAAFNAKNDAFVAEAIAAGTKAVQEIEAGTITSSWSPYKSREEALSYLYFYLGDLTASREPASAIPWLIKAGTFEGPAKTMPSTYARLAAAYHTGIFSAMQTDYNAKFAGKTETAEGKFAYEQLNVVMDRIIDAYARAVNLSGNDARYVAAKPAWTEMLQTFYKVRVGETMPDFDGYVATAMERPLPPAYEPKVYVAAPVPSKKR